MMMTSPASTLYRRRLIFSWPVFSLQPTWEEKKEPVSFSLLFPLPRERLSSSKPSVSSSLSTSHPASSCISLLSPTPALKQQHLLHTSLSSPSDYHTPPQSAPPSPPPLRTAGSPQPNQKISSSIWAREYWFDTGTWALAHSYSYISPPHLCQPYSYISAALS